MIPGLYPPLSTVCSGLCSLSPSLLCCLMVVFWYFPLTPNGEI